jgi:hypothetical protein
MPGRGWKQRFEQPIELSDGRRLITLYDAAEYIAGLAKPESEQAEWQIVREAVILIAEEGGPTMLARIAVLHALGLGGSLSAGRRYH